jgi:6-phosphogluconolactonase/glucosamine-6-phosphate isomerase/deaminase
MDTVVYLPPFGRPLLRDQLDWPCVQIFWSDERCVLLNHADSNYGLAREEILWQEATPHMYRYEG